MDISQKILSDITVFNKYAKFVPELKRRETWDELVERNMAMHIRKYPQMKQEIKDAYKYVYNRQVLPSMRSSSARLITAANRLVPASSTSFITNSATEARSCAVRGEACPMLSDAA